MNISKLLTVVLLLCINGTPITVKAQSAENQPKLRVGVAGEPPGVIVRDHQSDSAVTGISVEMWEQLAIALGLNYEIIYNHSIVNTLNQLAEKKIDIAIGGITTTAQNISRFDFTQPVHQDKLSILVPIHAPTPWSMIRPFLRWAFLSSVILIWLCLFTVGNLLWLAERHDNSEQFPKSYLPGVREGMWCALTTFSTVGYGDRYPITHLGRFIAGSWMIISLAVVATLIGGVASTLALAFSAQPYQKIRNTDDLKGVRLAVISGSTAVQWGQYYQARIVNVEEIDQGIKLLESNQVDGVLYSRLVLEHYLNENPQAPYQILGVDVGTQNYSIALTPNHPLTQKLNEQLLSIEMQLKFKEIQENWRTLTSNSDIQ